MRNVHTEFTFSPYPSIHPVCQPVSLLTSHCETFPQCHGDRPGQGTAMMMMMVVVVARTVAPKICAESHSQELLVGVGFSLRYHRAIGAIFAIMIGVRSIVIVCVAYFKTNTQHI